jgi:glutathione synthase/RimK-type ligase-like ATP-grasp enzyme
MCSLEATLIGLSRRYQEILETGVTPVFSRFEQLDRAFDKVQTLQFASRCGVPVPRSIPVDSNEQIAAAANEIGYPVVIKPRRSISIAGDELRTNRGPLYASDDQQLAGLVKQLPLHLEPPIVQEFIPGECVGGFFLIDQHGECLCEFAHERIRDVNPTGSGSTFR